MNLKTDKIFHILAIVVISILTGCNSHEIDGDKVYYVNWNESIGKNKTLIREADAETFKELEHSKYAIDKNNVYYEAGKLKDANPKTFISILDYYGKDDNFAYKGSEKINDADGQTFVVIDAGPYAKDNKDYYFETLAIKVSDLRTFKILNQNSAFGYLSKDKNYYYSSGKKYPLADYETFDEIGNEYAKDKLQVYYQDSVVLGADPTTFKTLEYSYGQDKNAKFRGQHKLNIKDPSSFEVLNFGFTKDKINVYINDSVVKNADPKTFQIINWMWSKDKKSYYYQGELISYVDYSTFRYLDYNYAIDKNNVYYYDQIIKEADAKTFKHIEKTQDAKDQNGCYSYGKKVDCKVLLQGY